MTQVAEILEKAFFEAGLTTELQYSTPTQIQNAMQTLDGIIKFLYGTDVGEQLQPWPLGNFGRASQSRMTPSGVMLTYPPINSRLVATNEEPLTVKLSVNPSPGARMAILDPYNRLQFFPITLDGNGRTIENAATVLLDTDGMNALWLYRDDLGNWAKVVPLLITDDMPFPEEYDQMFVIMMAMRLNPAYGRNISSVQAQFLKEYRQQFVNRYLQSAPLQIDPSISFPTQQSYDNFAQAWWGGSTEAFNRGWDWWW